MKTKRRFNWLYRISIVCFLLIPFTSIAQETTLISFELRDQYKTEYTEKSWQDSVLIFLANNRAGNKFNPIWEKAIYDSTQIILPNLPIKQVGIANLKGLPFFLKGFIRNKMPDDGNIWILMDWKGTFANAYHFVVNKCNILIFDRKRNLVYQNSVTNLNEMKLREILSVLRELEK